MSNDSSGESNDHSTGSGDHSTGLNPPAVITKIRVEIDGTLHVSHYAIGPQRKTLEEAMTDLKRFAQLERSERAGSNEPKSKTKLDWKPK